MRAFTFSDPAFLAKVRGGTGGGGSSWIARESVRGWRAVASSSDGSKLVTVTYAGYIYRSTDYGVSWTQLSPNNLFLSVASSMDGSIILATTDDPTNNAYLSTDSGATWKPITGYGTTWLLVSAAMSGDGVKQYITEQGHTIMVSWDTGGTWNYRGPGGLPGWTSVACSSDGVKAVACIIADQIYTSTDSGFVWTAQPGAGSRSWIGVASSADGTKLVAVAHGERVYTSTDSGVTWTARESSRLWVAVASSADGSILAAADPVTGIYVSFDSGVTWTQEDSGRNWVGIAMSADGSKMVAVVNGGRIYTRL